MVEEVFYTATPLPLSGGSLRSCEHCFYDRFNLGLDSLSHLCRCACVQDFADFEVYEQERYEAAYFTKSRIMTPSKMPVVMRNR